VAYADRAARALGARLTLGLRVNERGGADALHTHLEVSDGLMQRVGKRQQHLHVPAKT